ncbi:tRNA adenosine deaminase-associated protein [Rhodococcus sp. NPDC003382]|uniref:tRNA adenosine deaminase-associated protein n=1 Tax=unclassified Rhodococcus (in: high G+C Gram-positive bacteria) TaxID=192944 RepID=UPI0018CC84C9|nr:MULTISPECIES: tRNA adenosine deaminase-associated protein [unclassified Rhodococcus (in: high G+C Gram-positive bacteria)]MBH0122875.1 tRNA adenosine deaminase-associated protein [Rhodococcus sp. CX]MCK8673256.1 tRNA adenosine deaminase-associated protein [Rhodococcus sp. HM1]
MAAQRVGDKSPSVTTSGASGASSEDLDGFAVAVTREEGRWKCRALTSAALTSLATAETELRELRSSGAVFGLLNVDDEFFVIVRPAPAGTQLLLSDATMAVDYDIAADVLEALNIEIPDIDPDELDEVEPWEEGDLAILADMGLPEPVLAVILSETELYPDEQIEEIAQRCGFDDVLSSTLDKLQK